MIDWIEGLIAPRIADRRSHFVFPSQAAADSWLRRVPELFGVAAIETGRFIGWDRFKETLLSRRQTRRPADRVSRSLWTARTLARQSREPFLRRILGPFPPSPAFAGFLATIPPALAAIARSGSVGDDEILADLELLYRDYAAFLEDKGLFEPAWEALPRPEPEERFELIAPELMEDFETYARAVDAVPGISLHRLKRGGSGTLLRFPNLFEELRWTFLKIAGLLEEGVRPEDIAVSFPALDQAAAYVRAAAARAGVPVALREGELLSASPYGRLLKAMADCARSGFAFEETKALLLDRFAVWKNGLAAAARDLVRFGIERHAYAPYTDRGRKVDAWEESFATSGGAAALDLRDFYRRLRAALLAITGSANFRELETALVSFRQRFLDESGWEADEEKRVQRIMVELGALVRAEEELGCAGQIPDPFDLFLRGLGELRYVPRSSEAAVSVYPYRVSALIAARHHFVLGASQEGTSVRYAPASFLREDQRELLGLPDRDASEDFTGAYSLDPSTSFSYAEVALGGWSAPAPHFEPLPMPVSAYGELLQGDPLRAEAQAWKNGSPLPSSLLLFQKRAALAAAASLGPRGSDFGKPGTVASLRTRDAVLARRRTKTGSLRLSATQLEEYLGCPFGWLLTRGLGLEDEPSGIGFFDARLAGEMAHEAIRGLFARIAESGPFSALRLESYLRLVPEAVASVLPVFERDKGPFLMPMFSAYAPLLEDRLRRLLRAETWMEGWEVGEFERSFEKEYPELGIVLEGRADRVARQGEELALIDYKKRHLPRKAELLVGGGDPTEARGAGSLGKLQIAAYVTLCESSGGRVGRAAYWSIEDARRLVVLGPEGLKSREAYDVELAAFERSLAEAARGLSRGDFSLAAAGGEMCASCGWAAICRCRYATE